MRRYRCLALVGLMMVTGAVASAEDVAPSYQHLAFLEGLVGDWETEYELDGRKTAGVFRARWAPGKYSLTWSARTWLKDDGTPLSHGSGIIAWDPAKKRVRELASVSDGTLATAYFEIKDGKLVIDRNGTLADGTKFTTRAEGVLTENRYEFGESTWVTPDKKVVQTVGAGVFQRMPASVPNDLDAYDMFIKGSEYFVGDWASAAEIDGEVQKGTWSVRWSPDRSCLISHWTANTPQGPESGTRIHGWDAAAKKLLVVGFNSDGSSSIERYTLVSDRIDEGKITAVDAEGRVSKATARTDRIEPDRFTWTVTEDDKSTVYRFRRMSAAQTDDPAAAGVPHTDGRGAFASFSDLAVGGVWSATIDGANVEHAYRRTVNDQFVERTGKGDAIPSKCMIGINPLNDKCTWWSFYEDGGVGEAVLTQEAEGVWLLEGRSASPKGRSLYKGRLTRVNSDEVTEVIIEFVLHDQRQPVKTYTWIRTR